MGVLCAIHNAKLIRLLTQEGSYARSSHCEQASFLILTAGQTSWDGDGLPKASLA